MVEADEDYLVNGPVLTQDQKQDVMFHEAQSLAMMGRNVEAAHLVAAAIPSDHTGHGELDWTAYLTGLGFSRERQSRAGCRGLEDGERDRRWQ